MPETKSMAQWLRTEYPTLRETLADDLIAAEQKYREALPTRGTAGEEMGRAHLLDSGYAAYLAGAAYAARQKEQSAARREAAREAQSGYAAYLGAREKERQTALTRVTAKIVSGRIGDPDAAYTLALQYGLGRTDARKVADGAASLVRASGDSYRRTVMDRIIAEGLSAPYGKEYAMACGLGEEEAEEVARAAEAAIRHRDLGYSALSQMEQYYRQYN